MAAGLGELDPSVAEQYTAQVEAMVATGLAVFAFGPDPSTGRA